MAPCGDARYGWMRTKPVLLDGGYFKEGRKRQPQQPDMVHGQPRVSPRQLQQQRHQQRQRGRYTGERTAGYSGGTGGRPGSRRTRRRSSSSGSTASSYSSCSSDGAPPVPCRVVRRLHPAEEAQWARRVADEVAAGGGRGRVVGSGCADLGGGLLLGGWQVAQDVCLLRNMGVTHVLNLAPRQCADRCAAYARAGVAYLALDAVDEEGHGIIPEHFAAARRFIAGALYGGGTCLVHCYAGENRSAAVCCAFLVARQRVPLLAAVARIVARRPGVLSNRSFREQLVRAAAEEGLLG